MKFLDLKTEDGHKVRDFQYTAIDDATRIRALKIYKRHTQQNAIDFVDYVIAKFPFRINTIRADNGHEFQVKFHWHLEDLGIRHTYIKPRTPRLNGKVERSHGTDQCEFYQLLAYKDDVDLNAKLAEWEAFYNYHRPHGSLGGKTTSCNSCRNSGSGAIHMVLYVCRKGSHQALLRTDPFSLVCEFFRADLILTSVIQAI